MNAAVTAIAFCVGLAVGGVVTVAGLVFASLYDDHIEERKRRNRR